MSTSTVKNSSNNLINELCKDLISQVVKVFMEHDNISELKKKIIDPLISNISSKLVYCYLILIILLVLMIIINCIILYKVYF